MPDLSSDQIHFIAYSAPSLPGGNHAFTAKMSVVSGSAVNVSDLWQQKIKFQASAPRFKLSSGDVYSTSPPDGSVGDYANVVPSIGFHNPSLPWVRKPTTADTGYTPWLALVCVAQSELSSVITSTTTVEQYCRDHNLTVEDSDAAGDTLILLKIPQSYHYLLPPAADVPYTAAVKHSAMTGDIATLMGNRLPATGRNVVYLVSFENRYPLPYSADWQLPVLYSWSFESTDPAESSAHLLASMAQGDLSLRLPAVPYNNQHHLESNPNNWLKNGYVLLPHQFRNGQSAVSWYKGPLSASRVNVQQTLPARSADSLSLFDPSLGMLDISYSTAWQLGRQLALQSSDFSNTLYLWKRQMMLLEKYQQQVAGGDFSLPVLAKVNRWNVLNNAQAIFFRFGRTNENNKWEDFSGKNHEATPIGNLEVRLNDTFGSSVYLNMAAGSQYISIHTSFNVMATGTIFYSLWFNPNWDIGRGYEYGLFSVKSNEKVFFMVSLRKEQIVFYSSSDMINLTLTCPVDTSKSSDWQQIMVSITNTMDSPNRKYTTVKIYYQGQVVSSQPMTTPNISGTPNILLGDSVGCSDGSGEKFKGGLANFRVYKTSVNDGDMDLISQADLIAQKLHPWFNKWAILKNIPFNYLVPDERMLPAESIRFFKVDTHWLSCFADGAFSVGRSSNATLAEDARILERMQLIPFRNISGVIIRSASVGQVKGLYVDGFSERVSGTAPPSADTQLQCLRKESLSDDTLLILFEGNVKTIQIYPAPELVHYGVILDTSEGQYIYSKQIRNPDGTFMDYTLPLTNEFLNPATRILTLYLIAEVFQNKMRGQTPDINVTSAEFAMQMLEETWKVQINSAS